MMTTIPLVARDKSRNTPILELIWKGGPDGLHGNANTKYLVWPTFLGIGDQSSHFCGSETIEDQNCAHMIYCKVTSKPCLHVANKRKSCPWLHCVQNKLGNPFILGSGQYPSHIPPTFMSLQQIQLYFHRRHADVPEYNRCPQVRLLLYCKFWTR